MKLYKSLLILTSIVTFGSSLFAKELTRDDYIKFYQEAEMPNEALDNLERFKVQDGDSVEACIKKIFSVRKLHNKYHKKNYKKAFIWFKIMENNVRKSFKLYPKDKNLMMLASVMYSSGFNFSHLENCIYLAQENKAIPELNIAVYYFFYNYFENLQNKSDEDYQKEDYAIEFELIFGKMNRKQFTEKLILLRNYWQNLVDEEYAVKTGMSWLVENKKQQTPEEKSEARTLWKNIMEYMIKHDYYSEYSAKLALLAEETTDKK